MDYGCSSTPELSLWGRGHHHILPSEAASFLPSQGRPLIAGAGPLSQHAAIPIPGSVQLDDVADEERLAMQSIALVRVEGVDERYRQLGAVHMNMPEEATKNLETTISTIIQSIT